MIKMIKFLGGWAFGTWFLKITIFPIMGKVITNEMASSIMFVMIISVFTLVYGCIIGKS